VTQRTAFSDVFLRGIVIMASPLNTSAATDEAPSFTMVRVDVQEEDAASRVAQSRISLLFIDAWARALAGRLKNIRKTTTRITAYGALENRTRDAILDMHAGKNSRRSSAKLSHERGLVVNTQLQKSPNPKYPPALAVRKSWPTVVVVEELVGKNRNGTGGSWVTTSVVSAAKCWEDPVVTELGGGGGGGDGSSGDGGGGGGKRQRSSGGAASSSSSSSSSSSGAKAGAGGGSSSSKGSKRSKGGTGTGGTGGTGGKSNAKRKGKSGGYDYTQLHEIGEAHVGKIVNVYGVVASNTFPTETNGSDLKQGPIVLMAPADGLKGFVAASSGSSSSSKTQKTQKKSTPRRRSKRTASASSSSSSFVGDGADGGEGGDMGEGGGGDGGESGGEGRGSEGGKGGKPGGAQGGSMGDEDVSDEAIEDVLRCAVFRLENKKRGRGKHWCVVGLSAGRAHYVSFTFGRSSDDTKRELARTLVRQYGVAWRKAFQVVDGGDDENDDNDDDDDDDDAEENEGNRNNSTGDGGGDGDDDDDDDDDEDDDDDVGAGLVKIDLSIFASEYGTCPYIRSAGDVLRVHRATVRQRIIIFTFSADATYMYH
jgi:hypothetical protein